MDKKETLWRSACTLAATQQIAAAVVVHRLWPRQREAKKKTEGE
jgi:hypothetical protein